MRDAMAVGLVFDLALVVVSVVPLVWLLWLAAVLMMLVRCRVGIREELCELSFCLNG